MKQIWGVEIEIGHNILDYILSKEDREKAKVNFDRAFSGESFTIIEEYGSEKLKRSFYENDYNPIVDEEKNIAGVSVFVSNITNRKLSEINLHERAEGFRELAEMLPIIIFETSLDLTVSYANHLALNIFQYTKEEFECGINGLNMVVEEERISIKRKISESLLENKTVVAEYNALKKDGTNFPAIFHMSAIYSNGKLSGYRGAITDISKQKEAEDALKSNEERLKLAAATAKIGYFDWSIENAHTHWDEGMHKIHKLDPRSNVNRIDYFNGILHTKDRERIEKDFRESMQPGNHQVLFKQEYRLSFNYKQVRHVESQSLHIRNKNGVVTRIIGTALDITERKLAEKELIQSKRILQDVINSIPVRVFWKDLNSIFLGCNNQFAIDAGKKSPDEIVGKSDFELSANKNAEMFRRDDRRVMKTMQPMINFEMMELDAQGAEKWLSISKVPLQDETGNVYGLIGTYELITERKEIELALLESEEKYRALFEGTDEGILVYDSESELFLYANPAICKLLEWQETEIKALGMMDIHPKSEHSKVEINLEEMLSGAKKKSEEVRFLTKGGTTFPGTLAATLVKWGDKKCLVGFVNNLTDQKKSEQEMQESEERYKKLFYSSTDAIMTISPPKWEFTAGNDSILEMFNVDSLEEWTHLSPQKISPTYQPDGALSADKARYMIGKAMEDGSNFFEWTHKRVNGEDFPATVLLTRVDLHDHQFLQATVRDITEQKNVESVLKFQSELQSILMKIATDFINRPLNEMDVQMNASLKEMGEFVKTDRAYVFTYDHLKKTRSNTHEWCASGVAPIINDAQNRSYENLSELVDAHFSGGSVYIPDSAKLEPSPTKKLLQSQGVKSLLSVPLMNNDKCVGFVGFDSIREAHHYTNSEIDILRLFADVLVNINMRVESQKEFEKLLATTIDQNERLKEFSFMTSHNIRASVANLVGLTDMIELEPENMSYLEMLKITTGKLNVTVNNINELINFENQMGVFEKVECNLNEAILRVLELTNHIVQENNIEIKLSISANHLMSAYPAYLDSIIHNLLTNAIKYGVTKESKVIEIFSTQTSASTSLHFKDYGLGMNLKLHGHKLFKLGTRLHDNMEGQGLGLFMTHRQIEAMGGTIEIESQINSGSLFKVTLPK